MEELSLHILDIANNSVRAGATRIGIVVTADTISDKLTIVISDNGCGMTGEVVERIQDPFFTTRTTRKIGMGIPLYKQAAESTGGSVTIWSKVGEGTVVTAVFGLKHIDRMPMGSLGDSIITLVTSPENIDYLFTLTVDDRTFSFDTVEVKQQLDGMPLDTPEIAGYLREFLNENISLTDGGYIL